MSRNKAFDYLTTKLLQGNHKVPPSRNNCKERKGSVKCSNKISRKAAKAQRNSPVWAKYLKLGAWSLNLLKCSDMLEIFIHCKKRCHSIVINIKERQAATKEF